MLYSPINHRKQNPQFTEALHYQSCRDTCQNLLVLLDEITITDRDDKIDDIRDMLSECMEKNQEQNKLSN